MKVQVGKLFNDNKNNFQFPNNCLFTMLQNYNDIKCKALSLYKYCILNSCDFYVN